MARLRTYYRIIRSILFTSIIILVTVYVSLYILLSVPAIQSKIKREVEYELSKLLTTKVEIGDLQIFPFNEVRLHDIKVPTPDGKDCISIGTLGAGINLVRLISNGKIELSYAEILDLRGEIWQEKEGGKLNIDFIIKALSPKDKTKPPTKFDIKIRNILIRRSSINFDRLWQPDNRKREGSFDPNHITLTSLNADLAIPVLKNDEYDIDLRRLTFKLDNKLEINKLAAKVNISRQQSELQDFYLKIGSGTITMSDLEIRYKDLLNIKNIKDIHFPTPMEIVVRGRDILPAEYSYFFSPLAGLSGSYEMDLKTEISDDKINIQNFILTDSRQGFKFSVDGEITNVAEIHNSKISVNKFLLNIPRSLVGELIKFTPVNNIEIQKLPQMLGSISASGQGEYDYKTKEFQASLELNTDDGNLVGQGTGNFKEKNLYVDDLSVAVEDFNIGDILNSTKLGHTSFKLTGNALVNGINSEGNVICSIDYIDYNNKRIENINANLTKKGKGFAGNFNVDDPVGIINMDFSGELNGIESLLSLNGNIFNFHPSELGLINNNKNYNISTDITADLSGNSIDNLNGKISINDFILSSENIKKDIKIESITVYSDYDSETGNKHISFDSDIIKGSIDGIYHWKYLPGQINNYVADIFPAIFNHKDLKNESSNNDNLRISLRLLSESDLYDFLHFPVKPLANIEIKGEMDFKDSLMNLTVDAPYLLFGKDKLISESKLNVSQRGGQEANIELASCFPIKNDRASINVNISGFDNHADAGIHWSSVNNPESSGFINMNTGIFKEPNSKIPSIITHIKPSHFVLGNAKWNINESEIDYHNYELIVDGLNIGHDNQYINISGIASADKAHEMKINISDIDLSYIFDLLNINYVTFGGIANGEIYASELLTKTPVATTKELTVQNLSYNGTVLGDADITSYWNNDQKEVEIHASIEDENKYGAKVDGGIFVTRDSLSFDMNADKVNISFLKPFMSAFSSDVGGRASGAIKLFGNFKDIDMTGKAFADSIAMKVDYTNVYYHCSDSVYLYPGRISIPKVELKDKYGNKGYMTGEVRHRFFHDPEFEFRISGADRLLCYDTNAEINPDWYGRIFASGGGVLTGRPGIVSLFMDMNTEANTDFTFVLNETQTAVDYNFLTFTDKKKESVKDSIIIEESFIDKFYRKKAEENTSSTVFMMDLRASITTSAQMNIIMDPKAGDRIRAHGEGPMQMQYNTESDELRMYGKYTLAEGNYNFSLQELILRDFIIKEGSSISFNGDPLRAVLDIQAAYRVNTNLSDLDKSFSTDKDLNRTNVPVDAILNVEGDLQSPEITFDISLPTLSSDVERKVKSIISTDDLMNKQIIYLLALNKFYTPEYMGTVGNGGELASVASSTISSQISNIMGSITDKFTLAPSFRSDKGDFSDMEVDVSLSSRLLNNRLLLNGNFGYRDRNTSQTTFVGDFDLEYLLSKNGNLRLKAYNHFNDQYYYLRSALTTQGIGIVYRKEFDNPFSFLRRKKKKTVSENENKAKE